MKRSFKTLGPVGKFLALIVGAVLLVLGFMFSVVILAILAVVLLVGGAWFWWKTRALRRVLREEMAHVMQEASRRAAQDRAPASGEVIDGEASVVEESQRRPAMPEAQDRS